MVQELNIHMQKSEISLHLWPRTKTLKTDERPNCDTLQLLEENPIGQAEPYRIEA